MFQTLTAFVICNVFHFFSSLFIISKYKIKIRGEKSQQTGGVFLFLSFFVCVVCVWAGLSMFLLFSYSFC